MKNTKKNFFDAIKKTVLLAVPITSFRVVGTANAFFSMLLIATLGKTELAACALINTVQTTINVTGWSILFAVSTLAGYHLGKGSDIDIGRVFRQGIVASVILGIPMTIIYWYADQILYFFGEDKSLIEIVRPYFHVLAFNALPSMFYATFVQFITGVGKPKVAIYFAVLNLAFLLLPSYLLVYGKFGLPKLGMIGVAYSMIFVYVASTTIAIWYLFLNKSYRKFRIFICSFELEHLKKIFKIGFPISIQIASELSAFAFAVIIVGWIGQSSLAATQILNQLNMIMIMGPYGISLASNVLISQAFGKRDMKSIRMLGNAGILSGVVFTSIIALIYFIFPKNLIAIYSINLNDLSNAQIINIAILLFFIGGFSQIFDGIRNIIIGALRGLQDTIMPMWYGIIACWIIGVPLGYLLGIKLNYGAPGIIAAFLISWIVCTTLLIIRFIKKPRCMTVILINCHRDHKNTQKIISLISKK